MRELLSIIEKTINHNNDIAEFNSIYPNNNTKPGFTGDSGQNGNEVELASLTTIFIVMGSIYGVLLFAPIIQFLRIYFIGFPLRRVTTQKTFLTLLFLTCTFRTVFFFSVAFSSSKAGTFNLGKFSLERFTILDDLGCISFFTTFCLLILFWIEIVYHSRNKTKLYKARVKPLFFLSIGVIYILQIIIWICIFAISRDHRDQIDKADNTFYATISLCASLAFFYYGCKLSLKLKRHPLHSRNQRKKFIEVVIFTLLCTFCFLGRSLLFLIVSYYPKLHVNFLSVSIYYAVSEVVPSIFVIILFRKMPPKPATTQAYSPHSINSINKPIRYKSQDLERANYDKEFSDSEKASLIN
ncbi:hypothetical protein DICPUDRAFT_151665 [Dictyostelium purpureum]|uniref:THH1/TOM1/TOM3 domain-containing protein n=1 Tax=Dictyostelium purpureum TaxID=5786 RepID=F0ZJF8_DICPU|nr:uncharacterized protein DICPUDRAFT_151665 [Dictyostelium purpureum]EGC35912.1 hypothetical protein DICPUDRAFT_151665 [Dictyostelium purpureum]|eukprot:XP_003287566.1 hypothetical protein DICPUDRAFT_151665 [Dictyostelium purpureum]